MNVKAYIGWIVAGIIGMVAWAGHESGPTTPTVVGVSTTMVIGTNGDGTRHTRVVRGWSDGAVDTTMVSFVGPGVAECDIDSVCGPFVVVPGTCMADVDRNAVVGTSDLLTVLDGWGDCGQGGEWKLGKQWTNRHCSSIV